MGKYRKSKGVTEHYTSLEELRKAYGCKVVIKQTKDKEKLQAQRENFGNHHKCRACGNPMTYIGGGIMCCKNESCKGIKNEKKDSNGNTIVTYLTSYELLNDHFTEVADNLFYEAN